MGDAFNSGSKRRVWLLGGVDLEFDGTLVEQHAREVAVTDDPIDTGVVISDHATVQPYQLMIRAAVSDLKIHDDDSDIFAGEAGRAASAWDILLTIQEALMIFDVQTGLRLVKDMIITSLAADQDAKSATVLKFTATLRQITRVSTRTTTYPPRKAGKSARQASKKVSGGEKTAQAPAQPEKVRSTLFRAGQAVGAIP